MPAYDSSSPWSRQAHGAVPLDVPSDARVAAPVAAPVAASVPAQPAHAWLSAEAYGATSPAPGTYEPAPVPAASVPPIQVHVAPPSGGRGLAILGVVLGSLALLGTAVPILLLVLFGLMDDGGGGDYSGPTRGTIAPATGKALAGSALAAEITRNLTDQGEEPEDVACPDTAQVAQDVTTVCHGTDFGEETAFIVFFEDAKGSYTVMEV